MDLIRDKQFQFFLIVSNLCSWPTKFKKMSVSIWIHPLHNCTSSNYWVSAPAKRILKWFCCTWVRDASFPGRFGAPEEAVAGTGSRVTWSAPSPANHNIQGSRSPALPERKGRTLNISSLALAYCFWKVLLFFSFFPNCLVNVHLCRAQ